MSAEHRIDRWERTPPPARPMLVAALFEFSFGLLVFVVVVALVCVSEGVSPLTAIFGPLPGTPLIVWLAFVLTIVAVQGLIVLALRQPARLLRLLGAAGACVIAGIAFLWIAVVLYDLIVALLTGMERYVEVGGPVTLLFVPPALLIAALNARAGLLGARHLRRRTDASAAS